MPGSSNRIVSFANVYNKTENSGRSRTCPFVKRAPGVYSPYVFTPGFASPGKRCTVELESSVISRMISVIVGNKHNRSAEDAYSSVAPDPTFAFVGVPCCTTLDFVIAFWITIAFYTLLTSLFFIFKTDILMNNSF
jgi:hypothetical protein